MIDVAAQRLPELMQALTEQLGQERMSTWFNQVALQIADKTVSVLCPNPFLHKWLRDSFGAELRVVAKRLLGGDTRVEFIVDEAALAKAQVAPPAPASAGHAGSASESPTMVAGKIQPVPSGRQVAGRPRQTQLALDPDEVAQSPAAPSRGRRFANFDSFVVGTSNKLAYTAATMAAEQPGQVNPVVFHGPAGVGKTHLLEAVWTAVKKRDPRRQIVYLSAEQFTTHYVEALSGGLPSFRRKYRGVDVLLLDDVQFFRGKKATLIELLHTIDALASSGRQVVMAADRPPHELIDLGPEIVGRLAGGLVVRVDTPDEHVRRGVVRGLTEKLHLNLGQDVQEYVAGRLGNCCRELTGALHRLQAVARSTGEKITTRTAEQALSDMLSRSSKAVRLPDIERAICEVFGLDSTTLNSNKRTRSIAYPRMLAMWLARKYTRAALSEIGQYFGRRSHSTVVSAQKQVDKWILTDEGAAIGPSGTRLDEAVKLVERKLGAG